ncbi:von Willebrand factor A domain-containing protein 7-like isoform X2 [Pristis pectinata]|uniref:von Willebrand factor A domain-containing protein 7-like isoform X2 n=1 Tax=Pristis pectinata TaxID=685728 RepID=UPI00223E2F5D|nr:von Willebrand factor A domain-containing protein 7-like isoform X2 [Pristis pectinata]
MSNTRGRAFKGAGEPKMVRLLPPVYLLLLGARLVHCFFPILGMESRTHYNITETATLQAVLKVLQEIPSPEGNIVPAGTFRTDGSDLTAERLFAAYYGKPVSGWRFTLAILEMGLANGMVDALYMLDSRRHFDSETFLEGKELLLRGKASVVRRILAGKHSSARISMGAALHTLQDFYSHSNWLELGYETPNSTSSNPSSRSGISQRRAVRPARTVRTRNPAGTTSCPTSSVGRSSPLAISVSIRSAGPEASAVTVGGSTGRSPGSVGSTRTTLTSPHGHIHLQAAAVATQASLELFLDIRDAVGDRAFLQFLCVDPPTGISFVMDTTGSMNGQHRGRQAEDHPHRAEHPPLPVPALLLHPGPVQRSRRATKTEHNLQVRPHRRPV